MSTSNERSPKRWLGVVLLILFGALVAWDFSAIHQWLQATIIGIVIGLIVVLVSKAIDVDLGWPKG
jgi:FtsH-binding integral membrane protein